MARIRDLLRQLRADQERLSESLNSYIHCIDRFGRCDEVADRLARAERLPPKYAQDYWSDVKRELGKVRPLAAVLAPLPSAPDVEGLPAQFDTQLAAAIQSSAAPLPPDRKLLQARLEEVSELVGATRRTAKELGVHYEHEAKRGQSQVASVLASINELMEVQAEVSSTVDNLPDTGRKERAPGEERSNTAPRTGERPALGIKISDPRGRLTLEDLKKDDLVIGELVKVISKEAANSVLGIERYFRNLVQQVPIPEAFRRTRLAGWEPDADASARILIRWALGKGLNPVEQDCAVLGSFLKIMMADVGMDERRSLLLAMERYSLVSDSVLASLKRDFGRSP